MMIKSNVMNIKRLEKYKIISENTLYIHYYIAKCHIMSYRYHVLQIYSKV